MKNTQRVPINREYVFQLYAIFKIFILYKKTFKREIYKKIQSNEKVTGKSYQLLGKIVTKLRYSYFFRKVTKLLKKLQVT